MQRLDDELSAIDAIYPDCVRRLTPDVHEITLPSHSKLQIQIKFPANYPLEMPCIVNAVSVDLSHDERYLKGVFEKTLQNVFQPDFECIFDFLSELESVLPDEPEVSVDESVHNDVKLKEKDTKDTTKIDNARIENEPIAQQPPQQPIIQQVDPLQGWTISEPAVDRGSTFIAFVRKVHSVNEAQSFLETLKSDRKVAKSNHDMTAWRIQNANGTRVQDCDDDGETAAGGRLLHLISIMDLWNVMVVVSRWFGGTHIGPDRFKHINSSARDAIVKAGWIEDNKKDKKKKR